MGFELMPFLLKAIHRRTRLRSEEAEQTLCLPPLPLLLRQLASRQRVIVSKQKPQRAQGLRADALEDSCNDR
jgi:hypothetical protein